MHTALRSPLLYGEENGAVFEAANIPRWTFIACLLCDASLGFSNMDETEEFWELQERRKLWIGTCLHNLFKQQCHSSAETP